MAKTKCRIKRDDTVLVIAGKYRGRRGRVLKVLPEKGRVIVESDHLIRGGTMPNSAA